MRVDEESLRMPRVDRVLAHPMLADARATLGDARVVVLVREEIDLARQAAREGVGKPEEAELAARVVARTDSLVAQRTRKVINASGIILHTNLGRAPLSEAAVRSLSESAGGYGSLEVDLATGKRGGRGGFAEAALSALLHAEASLLVNNCAAALVLALSALGRDREVIVSRGELVEIGGGFRVPDIMRESGARLVEVGTTNKTRARDYDEALAAHPGALGVLRIHQSNFRQTGFVARPTLGELREVATQRGVLLMEDLGSGLLADLAPAGLREPTAADSLRQGVDLLLFSTDKALGGPQGGALVGRADLIQRARKHPLARALRMGRLPLVALEATLASYLAGRASEEIPTLRMAFEPAPAVRLRAERWAARLNAAGLSARVLATSAELGGGAVSEDALPSFAVVVEAPAEALALLLRRGEPAVIGRVVDGRLGFDARTVAPDEEEALLSAIAASATASLRSAP